MFSNVSINGTVFQAAVVSMIDGGFKVVGITDSNEAKEIVVKFGDNFTVTAEMPKAKAAKVAKAAKISPDAATMTVNVEGEKRGRGRPKGSKNAPKVIEDAPKAEVVEETVNAQFGDEDVPAMPKRGRGRPRKVVVATEAQSKWVCGYPKTKPPKQ